MAASITLYVKRDSKKRNSTKQVEFTESFLCDLKEATSVDNPTFILAADSFNYNLAKWDDRYYFIDNVVSVRRGLWEVSCVLDVLATYKAEILASTQFVSYSSHKTSIWLPDNRVAVENDSNVDVTSINTGNMTGGGGFYVLSVVGKDSCVTYAVHTKAYLAALINRTQSWEQDLYDDLITNQSYDFSDVEHALESVGQMITRTGVVGNAYSDAPSCIRSCIWVPFNYSSFTESWAGNLFLGQFDTGVAFPVCKTDPVVFIFGGSIPWHYSDWRRAVCEDVYIYLPYCGLINISSDSISEFDYISVTASVTATDGCIAYEVKAASQVIGTYSANASANYPIGISQQASAGEIIQTAFAGVEKTVSSLVQSSVSPVSATGAGLGAALGGIETVYSTIDRAMTRHNTCIGSIGGGAGSGLEPDIKIITVARSTATAPDSLKDTMGLPTMAPISLATLTGYCQCANAHVSAPAQASELDAIDRYLNSGFFIE